jgi:GntR family transcriptional regulator
MPASSPLAKPRYHQIADLLRRDIEKGRYRVGTLLPTELQLCEVYEISRHTAREALRVLMQDHMIERRQGSGTIVTASSRQRFNHSISSVADLLQYGATTRLKVIQSERIDADEELAELMNCAVGASLIHIHGLRSEQKDVTPFCVSDIYRIAGNDPLTKRLLEVRGAVYALIDELEIGHIGMVEQHINACPMTPVNAAELGVSKTTVALRIVRRYFDTDGKLILVAVNLHPGSDFVYSMSLKQSKV